ncbi:MAG TPA: hypothetical protein VIG08_11890 [Gemmatimonadales bacterium]|jgi:hypothetical protein
MIRGFAWLFWLVALFFFVGFMRRRRWAMGYGGCGGQGRFDRAPTMYRGQENQQSYVEELERRIADLEEKLDFTERLVSERREQRATS